MLKKSRNWWGLLLGISLFGTSQEDNKKEDKSAEALYENFYNLVLKWRLHREPAKMIKALINLANSTETASLHNQRLKGFLLGCIFQQYPYRIGEWSNKIWDSISDKRQATFLCIALYLINNSDGKEMLLSLLNEKSPGLNSRLLFLHDEMPSELPIEGETLKEVITYLVNNPSPISLSLEDIDINTPEMLEFLWFRFFITGNTAYLNRLIPKIGVVWQTEPEFQAIEWSPKDPDAFHDFVASSLFRVARANPDILTYYESEIISPSANYPPQVMGRLKNLVKLIHQTMPAAIPVPALFNDPDIGKDIFLMKLSSLKQPSPEGKEILKSMIKYLEYKSVVKPTLSEEEAREAALVFMIAYNWGVPEAVVKNWRGQVSEVKAFRYINQVLHYKPNDPRMNHYAGVVNLELGELDVAQKHFEIAYQNGYKQSTFFLGVLALGRDNEKGRKYLEQYHQLYPNDEKTNFYLKALDENRIQKPLVFYQNQL